MALLLVVSDHDPGLWVELVIDDEARWHGACTYCPNWGLTLRESYNLSDSHEEAVAHVDHGPH